VDYPTIAFETAMTALLTLLAYIGAILYLLTPAHAAWWIWRQRERGLNAALGIGYLTAWLVVTALLVIFFLSGAWYSESTPLSAKIIEALVVFAIFFLFPITSVIHLRHRTWG